MSLSNRISIDLLPNGYEAAVVIRDDDICYFTPPYMVELLYEKAWRENFKVSLSVIPRVKAIEDQLVPAIFRGKKSTYEISKNRELVEYLIEKLSSNEIDIMQHGYTHEMIGKIPEFRIYDAGEIRKRLVHGREILENLFKIKVKMFIPPWDSISDQALKVLEQENLSVSLLNESKRRRQWFNLISLNFRKFISEMVSLKPLKNQKSITSMNNENIFTFFNYNGNYSLIFNNGSWNANIRINIVDTSKESFISKDNSIKGIICILNHYHNYYDEWQNEINIKKLDHFYNLLDLFNEPKIWKASLIEVVERIRKLSHVKLNVKGNKILLFSGENIDGLTIHGEDCSLTPMNKDGVKIKKVENRSSVIFNNLKKGERKEILVNLD